MNRDLEDHFALALCFALERSRRDLVEALGLLRDAECTTPPVDAQRLLARAIDRLELMRLALARGGDGPVLA